MKNVLYEFTPKSAIGSPLRSDALTGQLLCLYREAHGENELKKLIKDFKAGELPFVLSDGFPENALPLPIVPNMRRDEFNKICEQLDNHSKFDLLQIQKKTKKVQFLCRDDWLALRESLSAKNLFLFLKEKDNENRPNLKISTVPELHNIIERNTGKTLAEGGLFTTENIWYGEGKEQTTLNVYAKVCDDFQEKLDKLFEHLSLLGYGRDASVGKGQFEIKRSEQSIDSLYEKIEPTHWMNLSTFSSTNPADLSGYYQIEAKFGKVWNGFGETRPFKKPILVFKAGSVFKNQPQNPKDTVLRSIHIDEKIIQCNSAVMIPLILEDKQ